jgi:predicted AlkP superfamily phosphohydrolase/phosphomutase
MPPIIVLGLDGACWPLLQPWLRGGQLPNLKRLQDEAIWGSLDSQFPPVTSPNWRCYATGKNPGKLGVFWWEIVDRENKTIRNPTADDFDGVPFWEDLSRRGLKTGVINFPTGYPPVEISKLKFSAGGPGAREHGFATPASWESLLKRKYNYRVHPRSVIYSREQIEKLGPELEQLIRTRFEVALDLLAEGVDFLHITIFYINVLQHFCYRQAPTLRAWRMIDHFIGRFHEYARSSDASLVLMSDHGCGPVDTVFYVNTWLASKGYLATAFQRSGVNPGFSFSKQQAINLARRLGADSFLRRIIPRWMQNALPNEGGTFDKEAKAARLDWDRSRALASGQGLIYLIRDRSNPENKELRNQIARELLALTNPVSGAQVVKSVHFKEELFSGPYLDQAPDLIFEQGEGVFASGGIAHEQIFSKPEKWAADNLPQGLYLAYGQHFRQNQRLDGVNILDLAPTILHSMDQEIPADMDGIVKKVLYEPGSEPETREIRFREPIHKENKRKLSNQGHEKALRERLKDLGYLE